MSAEQELFALLKDARPKVAHPSKPAEKKQAPILVRAVRFAAQLPELGGAVELCPRRGFDPVHCSRCGAERRQEERTPRCWSVLPCACKGTREVGR